MSYLIDRQAAIDALHKWEGAYNWDETCREDRKIAYSPSDVIEALPQAEPERKIGRWITDDEYIDCSICRREKWSRVPYENLVKRFRYCPNCGADMRGE